MDQDDERLQRLDDLLSALPIDDEPMTLSELDGYITGILACPEMIPPSDWLADVWGERKDAGFPDLKTAQETIGAVMAHYNAVAEAMTRSLWLEPIYEIDSISEEVLWEAWIAGFTHAMALRPKAWEALLDRADDETRESMIFIMALADINIGESKFSDAEIYEIDLEAPDLIPNCVATILHQSRPELSRTQAANLPGRPHQSAPRPGRNDPCPCGSGRKYKQCCGKN